MVFDFQNREVILGGGGRGEGGQRWMRTKRLYQEHKAHGGRVKGSQAWSHR